MERVDTQSYVGNNRKNIVIFVGDSGSGKSYYEKELTKYGFDKVISHTTREKRVGEVDGIDYHFVSKEDFQDIEFIESVEVHGNFYGVSKQEINSKGDRVVVVTEPDGTKQILDQMDAIVVLLNIDKEQRKQNMISRGDKIENIEYRLANENFKNNLKQLEIEPDIVINKMLKNMDYLLNKIDSIIKLREIDNSFRMRSEIF